MQREREEGYTGNCCYIAAGDGILMAQKVGAKLWHMNASDSGVGAVLCPGLNYGHGAYDSDAVPANISLSRPSAATANATASNGFIALDKYGKRFVNEAREDSHGYGKREYLFFYDGVECECPQVLPPCCRWHRQRWRRWNSRSCLCSLP